VEVAAREEKDFFNDNIIREVFSLLLREKLIGLSLVHKILRWHHTGFNLHSQVRVRDKVQACRVGKYMIRPLLSLKRLGFDESEGCVCYLRFPSWPSALLPLMLSSRNF